MSDFQNNTRKNPPIVENLQYKYYYDGADPENPIAGDLVEYVCAAKPGAKLNEHKWQIKKYVYVNDNIIEIQFADNSTTMNKRPDERTDYTYTIAAS